MNSHVPNHLPMRATTTVKTWLDFKRYGFLWNPDAPHDMRDIFCHKDVIPEARLGIGKRLRPGEVVDITYIQDDKGRLKVIKLEFPNPGNITRGNPPAIAQT